jgi:hypothetical protein
MRYQALLGLMAIVLLIAAMTSIDTQQILWDPPWPARLGMGVVGVLLALAAALMRRRALSATRRDTR